MKPRRRAGSLAVACGSLWLTGACATATRALEDERRPAPPAATRTEIVDRKSADSQAVETGHVAPGEETRPVADQGPPSDITCLPGNAGVTCHDRVDVPATDALDLRPLDSSSMTSDELRALGPDSAAWIAFARAAAGSLSGAERIYVDGMPAPAALSSSTIGRITVNGDPFTAEHADVGETRIDIDLLMPDRRWRINLSSPSFGAGGGSPLGNTGAPVSRAMAMGLSGAVPRLPITFSFQTSARTDARRPLFADPETGLLVRGLPTSSGDDVRTTSESASLIAGAVFATQNVVVRGTFTGSGMLAEHAGIGGINAVSTGQRLDSQSRGLQVTWRVADGARLHRGGFSVQRDRLGATADSSEPFAIVSGHVASGGDETASETRQTSAWTARHVVDGAGGTWKAGLTASHGVVTHARAPNPLGRFQRSGVDAATGTWTVSTGPIDAAARTTSAAAFAERFVVRGPRATLRAGLRLDWQDGAGLIASPRVAGAARVAGIQLSGGAGLFVRAWTPDLFAVADAGDGTTGLTFVRHDVEAASLAGLDPSTGEWLRARLADGFERRRDLVVRAGVQRSFGFARAGIEHTWTRGSSLPGTVRERVPDGLLDVIASDRRLRRHQTHARASARRGAAAVNAHYQHVWSFDDGDAPLAVPAVAGDIAGEWARSAGVPRHAAGVTASLRLPFRLRALLSADARSGTPYMVTTGRDPDRLAAFTDRAGLPRNAGLLPPFRKVSVSLSRTVRVPRVASLAFDVGIRADNLTDHRNITSVGAVAGTPMFGVPLDAAPARSLRFWIALAR